jgi:hypothetical protein
MKAQKERGGILPLILNLGTRSGAVNPFCAMDPFHSLVKSTDLFSEMHKIKHTDMDCITKETNYAEIQFSKYVKKTYM